MPTGDPKPWQLWGCRMGYWYKTVTSDHVTIDPDGSWQWFEPEPSRTAPRYIEPYVPLIYPEPYYPMEVHVPQPIAQGWECPRCHRINAPSVKQCTCEPEDAP